MNAIEVLRFQTNIENVKEHVRQALQSHTVFQFLPWNEQYVCSACDARSYDEDELDSLHKEGCKLVQQQESQRILKEWVNAHD